MNSETKQLEATFGMALMDAVPVLLFAVSIILIGTGFSNPLYLCGAVLCTLAGLGKVVWKLILAGGKKDIRWLFMQFRVTMPLGFTLIILSVIFYRKQINWSFLGKCFSHPAGIILFGLGFLLMGVMFVLAVKLDPNQPGSNWIEQSVNTFAQLFILCGVALFVYAGTYYPAQTQALECLSGSGSVNITRESDHILFEGPGNENALVFYPGALVEYTAYAPFLFELAEQGIDCFLVEMPYNFAFFGVNKAEKFIQAYDYKSWYIGGHSLGGAMAGAFASKHSEELAGVMLLAAYSTSDISSLKAVSVYGDRDGVLKRDKYEANKSNLPGDYIENIIAGGNHAGFACYGPQKGDNEAVIGVEEQIKRTVETVVGAFLQ